MKTLDTVIKEMPKAYIDHCKGTNEFIVIILANDVYDKNQKKIKKVKGDLKYKGYKIEISDNAELGGIYITIRS